MVSNGVEPIQRDLNLLPLFTNSTDPFSPFLPLSDFRRFSFRDNVTCKTASSLSSVIYITVRSLGLLYVLTSSSLSLSLFPLRPKIYLSHGYVSITKALQEGFKGLSFSFWPEDPHSSAKTQKNAQRRHQ